MAGERDHAEAKEGTERRGKDGIAAARSQVRGHKSALPVLAALVALLTVSGCDIALAGTCKPGDPKLAGHYYLNGVMEVGSELLLEPDGSFEFALAYGALDQYGKGCWRVEGDRVLVVPEGRSAPAAHYSMDDSSFVGFVLTIEGKALAWDLGDGHKGLYEKE
jgi:hypothetical protein